MLYPNEVVVENIEFINENYSHAKSSGVQFFYIGKKIIISSSYKLSLNCDLFHFDNVLYIVCQCLHNIKRNSSWNLKVIPLVNS